MTQLFMGYKPGVGPVVKVLKYDGDDALTLANDAYGRYYFNSELQAISYTKAPWKVNLNAGAYVPGNWYDLGGDANNSLRSIGWTNSRAWVMAFPQALFPGDAFIPIAEVRLPDPATGRIQAALRVRDWISKQTTNQHGVMTAYQFPNVSMQMSVFATFGDWRGRVEPRFSTRAGQWATVYGPGLSGADGGYPGSLIWDPTPRNVVTVWWDLPADSSPVPNPSLPPQSGQENVRLNSAGFIVTRPGNTVDGSSGRQRIIDSTRNPPLCLMAGETVSFAPGGSAFVAAPPGISLSEDCVVEVMARVTGAAQYVPAMIISGYTPDFDVALTYSVASNGVTFYNGGQAALTVRYAVFGVDFRPPSTGGNQIMRRANDGTRDYIQIKKPGTSDSAPLPNDILLDTRFPTLQIVSEGWLPLSAFNEAADSREMGNVAKTISFTNSGFRPYLKYTTVFPGCILPPMFAQIYHYPENSGAYNHQPTNQSAIARVEDTYVKFHLSPGNPSTMTSPEAGAWKLNFTYPDPLGIRYYIFAIPL